MDPAAEVARIKAAFAAREATWMARVRARLTYGPATTRQLADACGCKIKGSFLKFLQTHKREGTMVVIGTMPGPRGLPNAIWEWAHIGKAISRSGSSLD